MWSCVWLGPEFVIFFTPFSDKVFGKVGRQVMANGNAVPITMVLTKSLAEALNGRIYVTIYGPSQMNKKGAWVKMLEIECIGI